MLTSDEGSAEQQRLFTLFQRPECGFASSERRVAADPLSSDSRNAEFLTRFNCFGWSASVSVSCFDIGLPFAGDKNAGAV